MTKVSTRSEATLQITEVHPQQSTGMPEVPLISMTKNPRYVFLKQAAELRSYFGELCVDVCAPDDHGIAFSEIADGQIGNLAFQSGPKYDRSSFKGRAKELGCLLPSSRAICFWRKRAAPAFYHCPTAVSSAAGVSAKEDARAAVRGLD